MLVGMSFATRWPSLADQLDLATTLYGRRGPRMVFDWLDHQLSLVDNIDFAREFSDHIELPGIRPLDYAHRVVRTQHGDLVGGIRFYNRDVRRPFVEIVAHSFEAVDTLAGCVRTEWSMFCPAHMRLRAKPGRIEGDGVVLDHSIHVGRYGQMSGLLQEQVTQLVTRPDRPVWS
jgi:hypothetical protein